MEQPSIDETCISETDAATDGPSNGAGPQRVELSGEVPERPAPQQPMKEEENSASQQRELNPQAGCFIPQQQKAASCSNGGARSSAPPAEGPAAWGPGHRRSMQHHRHAPHHAPMGAAWANPYVAAATALRQQIYYPAAAWAHAAAGGPHTAVFQQLPDGSWVQVIGASPYGYVMAPPPPPRRSSASSRSTASGIVSTRAPSAPSLNDLCVVDGATSISSATTSSAQSEASSSAGVATSLVSPAAAAQISQDLSAAPSADLPEPPRDASGASASTSGSESSDFGWGSLTVGILQNIVARLGEGEAKVLRGVSRHWRRVVDHNLESLTPNELQAKVMVARFPNLKTLHLTNCSHIRNRALLIISRAGLNLQTLTLGDDTFKPWVTNEGLACIAEIPTLTSLHLHDCNGVTNNGLLALTKLQSLSTLSLKGCRKLTNGAFEALQGHPALTELNLYGCRLTDKGLMPLMSLQLVSLRLGHTRVRDEGLAYLAQITTLQELHFDQEELSDAGVAQLTSLTRLEFLALRDCGEVSGDSLSVLIPALPNLISLDLYKNFTMDDSQLTRCLEFLGAVTFLDLRGTPVTEDGLQQLTKLSCLQKLCLAPTNECLWSPYLCVVSNLTQLTSLSINNCTLISFGQLETLRQLKLLRELDLSHDSCSGSGAGSGPELISQQPFNPTAINAMAAITSLTSIDLSRRPVHQEHLSTLAERLPRLHNLIIVGCPVLYTEVQSLQRRFPDLVIHRKPLYDVSCSSSDHGFG